MQQHELSICCGVQMMEMIACYNHLCCSYICCFSRRYKTSQAEGSDVFIQGSPGGESNSPLWRHVALCSIAPFEDRSAAASESAVPPTGYSVKAQQ